MPQDQRTIVFYLAIAAAVVLVLVGLMYFAGIGVASMQHSKRALACIGLAVLAAIVAFASRPAPQVAYGRR